MIVVFFTTTTLYKQFLHNSPHVTYTEQNKTNIHSVNNIYTSFFLFISRLILLWEYGARINSCSGRTIYKERERGTGSEGGLDCGGEGDGAFFPCVEEVDVSPFVRHLSEFSEVSGVLDLHLLDLVRTVSRHLDREPPVTRAGQHNELHGLRGSDNGWSWGPRSIGRSCGRGSGRGGGGCGPLCGGRGRSGPFGG